MKPMLPEILNAIEAGWIPVVVTILTAGASAYVVSWIAFGRYRKEKIWDQKIKEYNRLFDGLYKIAVSFSDEILTLSSGRELTGQESKNLNMLYKAGNEEISRQVHIGEVFLPNMVIAELKKLSSSLKFSKKPELYIDSLIQSNNSIYYSIDVIKKIAKEDLTPQSYWVRGTQLVTKTGARKR
ncbi:MAG: hypothetical protein ACTSUY_09425 [Alphaproteobacteria bacterium]